MFIKELAKHGSKMGVIAKNTEDYISFLVNVEVDKYTDKNGEERSKEIILRFIDSIKFMSSGLDSLVNNLVRGGGEFFGFENYSDHQCELLIRKGIYPYEYMGSWDRFEETTLPPVSSFYSKLTCLELVIKIKNMPGKFGETLGLETWENTTIYIYELTLSC